MVMQLLLFYLTRSNIFSIFEVFTSWKHPFVCVLLAVEVSTKITFKNYLIDISENRRRQIPSSLFVSTIVWIARLLSFEEGKLLELRPDEVSFLGFLCDRKPRSSGDESGDHARVVAFANEGL